MPIINIQTKISKTLTKGLRITIIILTIAFALSALGIENDYALIIAIIVVFMIYNPLTASLFGGTFGLRLVGIQEKIKSFLKEASFF